MFFSGVAISIAIIVLSALYFLKQNNSKKGNSSINTNEVKKQVKKRENPKVYIFFGSQTGTAEGFAKDLADELTDSGILSSFVDLEDYSEENFLSMKVQGNCTLIFLVATYGEGEPTDNAADFYKWLRKEATPEQFENVKVAVFGLGNKQYEIYNGMGRNVKKRLEKLGSEFVCEYGEGDEDDDLETDYELWCDILKKSLFSLYLNKEYKIASISKNKSNVEDKGITKSKFSLEFIEDISLYNLSDKYLSCFGKYNIGFEDNFDNLISNGGISLKKVELSSKHFFQNDSFELKTKRELRQSSGIDNLGSTLHLEFAPETEITFNTADNLAILAQNETSLVEELASLLDLFSHLDKWFTIKPNEDKEFTMFPVPTTLRTVLTYYVSINQTPTRQFMNKISEFANISEHKDRIRKLSMKENHEEFQKVILDRDRDLIEFIEMFPSINSHTILPNLVRFIEILPRLQPRYYTTSSTSLIKPTSVHVTASVVTQNKRGIPKGRLFKGVCTNYLARVQENQKIYGFIRPSSFKFPEDPTKPLILIGPGTGIAPMRAFLQEREHIQQKEKIGKCLLFFGCRRQDEDYLYKTELQTYLETEVLDELIVAFSRETNQKVYVQHKVKEKGEQLVDLICNQKASIFVCGATQMGRDVMRTFEELFVTLQFEGDIEKGKKFVKELVEKGRYTQELWST